MADCGEDVEAAERKHWRDVQRTFLMYEDFFEFHVERRQLHLNRLAACYADRLPAVTFDHFNVLCDAARNNQLLLRDMVDFHEARTTEPGQPFKVVDKYDGQPIPAAQQHRNSAVLHSLYREWSSGGLNERLNSFGPIIDSLKRFLPVTTDNIYRQRVSVPGCGLGRLPVEISALGYSCEGNEFSAFMAMASNFVLNGIDEPNCYSIHPWVDRTCNVVQVQDVSEGSLVPDRTAMNILRDGPYYNDEMARRDAFDAAAATVASTNAGGATHDDGNMHQGQGQGQRGHNDVPVFSMAAGDFMEIYGNAENEGQWDAVVTCFFMDTAPVVFDYIETIHRMLRPGGVWVNLGPLLYHWVVDEEQNHDSRYDASVELSWEELRHVIGGYNFSFLQEEYQESCYGRCPSSLMWTTYRAIHFAARKDEVYCAPCAPPETNNP